MPESGKIKPQYLYKKFSFGSNDLIGNKFTGIDSL